MTKTNNVVKQMKATKMKAERIDREEKMREEKLERLEARKQASRDKRWARVDREDWRY